MSDHPTTTEPQMAGFQIICPCQTPLNRVDSSATGSDWRCDQGHTWTRRAAWGSQPAAWMRTDTTRAQRVRDALDRVLGGDA